ncbi:rRNA adenine N-6-methyltransferase family protein [Streptomyces sp. NPDC002004]
MQRCAPVGLSRRRSGASRKDFLSDQATHDSGRSGRRCRPLCGSRLPDPWGPWGQHFLRTLDSAHALLERAGIPAGAHVLEVGAGLGTLSSAIATAGHRIWAVEKDERLRSQLTDQLAPFGSRARITFGDVRHLNLAAGLDLGSALVSIMPFDPELSTELIRQGRCSGSVGAQAPGPAGVLRRGSGAQRARAP